LAWRQLLAAVRLQRQRLPSSGTSPCGTKRAITQRPPGGIRCRVPPVPNASGRTHRRMHAVSQSTADRRGMEVNSCKAPIVRVLRTKFCCRMAATQDSHQAIALAALPSPTLSSWRIGVDLLATTPNFRDKVLKIVQYAHRLLILAGVRGCTQKAAATLSAARRLGVWGESLPELTAMVDAFRQRHYSTALLKAFEGAGLLIEDISICELAGLLPSPIAAWADRLGDQAWLACAGVYFTRALTGLLELWWQRPQFPTIDAAVGAVYAAGAAAGAAATDGGVETAAAEASPPRDVSSSSSSSSSSPAPVHAFAPLGVAQLAAAPAVHSQSPLPPAAATSPAMPPLAAAPPPLPSTALTDFHARVETWRRQWRIAVLNAAKCTCDLLQALQPLLPALRLPPAAGTAFGFVGAICSVLRMWLTALDAARAAAAATTAKAAAG